MHCVYAKVCCWLLTRLLTQELTEKGQVFDASRPHQPQHPAADCASLHLKALCLSVYSQSRRILHHTNQGRSLGAADIILKEVCYTRHITPAFTEYSCINLKML